MRLPGLTWRNARVALGVPVTVLFSWLAFAHMDWNAGWKVVASAQPWWIGAGVALLAIEYSMRILRWWMILRCLAPGLPYSRCAGPFIASVAADNVFGFRSGDVVRTFAFQKQLGLTPLHVLSTVVVERLLGITTLLLIFFATLSGADPDRMPAALIDGSRWMIVLSVSSLIVLLSAPARLAAKAHAASSRLSASGHRLSARVAGWAEQILNSFAMIRSPKLISKLFLLSLVIWLLEGTVFAMVARSLSLTGLGAGPWFAHAAGTLATIIPSAPGNVGPYDYFIIVGMMAYGVPHTMATVFGIVAHAVIWLPPTLAGLAWVVLPAGRSMWNRIGKVAACTDSDVQ